MSDIVEHKQEKKILTPFEKNYQMASFLSNSDIIPSRFKNKISDCFIALEMSQRTGASFLEVVQNLFVVKGTPSWKATFIISQINRSGKFDGPLLFEPTGSGQNLEVTAAANYKGKKLTASASMEMARRENWVSNPKYNSMPEQMLTYRAASFFCRKYCPEVLFGMYTTDEIEDVNFSKQKTQVIEPKNIAPNVKEVKEKYNGKPIPPKPPTGYDPKIKSHQDALIKALEERGVEFDSWDKIGEAMKGKSITELDKVLKELE